MTEPEIYRLSPNGNWAVSVAVPDSEHRHRYCDGDTHRGQLFEAGELRVFASHATGRTEIRLAGPNIRQDGTPGKRTLSQRADREYVMRDYPLAWAAVTTALGELARQITADAEQARAEIEGVLS